MSDSDVLQRAAALLRSAHDGQREGSGFTRARILSSLAERRRPRRGRWLVLAPLGTLLLVGSAWAQSTGNWPRVWQTVASLLRVASVLRVEKPVSAPRGALAPQAAPGLPQLAPAAAPPEEPALPLPAASPAPAPHAKAPKPARSAASTAAPSPGPEPPAPDPELRQFRAAHERQLQAQNALGPEQAQRRAAIQAYAEYLRAYPHGRFVPEARYNTALDWIKLGDVVAARTALAPFAAGTYDGYRQQEARELLEALEPPK